LVGGEIITENLMNITFRFAMPDEAGLLAPLNANLIRDEGHRNPMTVAQLTERMTNWLKEDYQAILFLNGKEIIGYALFRRDAEFTYVNQLYVLPKYRRLGVGRNSISWLQKNITSKPQRVRIDVLVGNATGLAFWRSIGFKDYCVTLELE
jgi:ribosomal protein S18 acetylase RimI-like enzyme